MNKKEILPALLSGLLMPLAFPNMNLSIIAWICLVPLLVSTAETSPAKGFLLGMITGTLFHLGLIYWVTVSMITYGRLPFAVSLLVLFLFAFVLGIFIAVPVGLGCYIRKYLRLSLPITLPFLWTAAEYVKSWILTGFPWENLGYSQFRTLPVIQIADITGVYGITFLIVFTNGVLFSLASGCFRKQKIRWKEISALVLLLAVTLLYGQARLNRVDKENDPPVKISLVQPNIPQNVKWNPDYRKKTLQKLETLSLKSTDQKPDLIIWPESATPFFFQSAGPHKKMVETIVRQASTHLLFGSPSYEKIPGHTRLFNSAFLVTPDNRIQGKYNKIHLVPYGEYIPLKPLFPFLDKMVAGIGDFSSGNMIKNLEIPRSAFAVIICYEIIFPDLVRKFVRNGAGFIVNITNDAWFGRTSAPYQHLSMSALRAVENRRYVVRAANTGISAFIAPSGKIFKQTDIFTDDSITAMIHKRTNLTLYTRYGDLFALFCTAAALLFVFSAGRQKKRKKQH